MPGRRFSECALQFSTPRLLVREFGLSDHAALYAVESDAAVTRYLPYEPRSFDAVRKLIVERLQEQGSIERAVYDLAIEQHGTGALLGRCGLKIDAGMQRSAMIWYVLAPQYWGRGFATEAVRALVSVAFREMALHRLWADIDPRNVGSLRVVEKLGFLREGHLRENYFLKGEWCDTYLYGLLAREWR